MGILGAAVATIIGQFVAAVIAIVFNVCFNKETSIILKNFLPDLELIKEIMVISIPSMLMQAIGTIMTLSMNAILIGFSNTALNVFGVYFKLQSFVFMPVFGLNNGMVPIISYNYGAKHKKRVFDTMKLAYVAAILYTVCGLLAFQIFPGALLSIFNATDEMIAIGTTALRTISWSFLFAGFSIVSISSCQALGKSIYGLFSSIGRQLVILIPVAFLLSLTGNVAAVWWAFPIAELASLVLCAIFVINTFRAAFPKEAINEK
jgi:Na+-driven multidrug efflux pump